MFFNKGSKIILANANFRGNISRQLDSPDPFGDAL
jgi:hypothetical protein